MQYLGKNNISVDAYIRGVLNGDAVILGKALSLLESNLESDRNRSMEVLEGLLQNAGNSIRVGITGAPGVGKSTFIEALGLFLVNNGHKVAVLTVDPSSQLSKGSILGDKTRMEQLSKSERAFIRPSAAGSSLGGVAHHTRESVLVCEAAGFDVVLVETVGVGQSEVMVSEMVDFSLLLMIAGAGDELQGIKKGIVEIADALVITKADGDNRERAIQTQHIFKNALHLVSGKNSNWEPRVLTCSARDNVGIKEVWATVETYHQTMLENGYLEGQRALQRENWMQDCIKTGIERYLEGKSVHIDLKKLKLQVSQGQMLPAKAAALMLQDILKDK